MDIQKGQHSAVVDAKMTMRAFRRGYPQLFDHFFVCCTGLRFAPVTFSKYELFRARDFFLCDSPAGYFVEGCFPMHESMCVCVNK